MNKKQRMKNRDTAKWLASAAAPLCPKCGKRGPHWIGVPTTLQDLLDGAAPEGFWACDSTTLEPTAIREQQEPAPRSGVGLNGLFDRGEKLRRYGRNA